MKIIKRILIIPVLIVSIYLLGMTITDYRPEERIELSPYQESSHILDTDSLKITTFNIGYGVLDQNADFFMEGGKQSKAINQSTVKGNINSIITFLKTLESDIYLLQEVDYKAMRSKNINEVDIFINEFPNFEATYAVNYNVPWVPVPLHDPYGYVNSGLLTISRYQGKSTRYQFPGEEAWPRQLALLDRCFTETRYKYLDYEVIVLNVHMSAYDAGGEIREQQVAYLKTYLEQLQQENAFVIVGGDFNHELPGTNSNDFNTKDKPEWLKSMDTNFEGYNWQVINTQPTSRSMEQPYTKGQNYECIIDGFLVSDNIKVLNITTHNLDYKNSDHNPVTIECLFY